MKTTLREIKSYLPCAKGWHNLVEEIGTSDLDTEVTILQILEINGVKDAYWALRTQDYRYYCLILANVAESVLHIFEDEYPDDKRPRQAIEAIRKWHAGEINGEELNRYVSDAYDAYAYNASDAAYAAYVATRANAYAATYVACAVSDAADAANAAGKKQWRTNESILRKYLELK